MKNNTPPSLSSISDPHACAPGTSVLVPSTPVLGLPSLLFLPCPRSRPLLSAHSPSLTRVRRVMDTLVRTPYGCLLVDDPMFSNEPDCEPDFPTPKGGVRIRPATFMPIPFSPPLPSIYHLHPLRPLRQFEFNKIP